MKTTRLLVVTMLFTGVAALSSAGPSPQTLNQQDIVRAENKAKADSQAKTQPATQVAACCAKNCNCGGMKKS